MLRAIELNDDLCVVTDEIDDVSANRCLPAEMHSLALETAKDRPENPFGVGGIRAKPSCKSVRHRPHPTRSLSCARRPPRKGEVKLELEQILRLIQ